MLSTISILLRNFTSVSFLIVNCTIYILLFFLSKKTNMRLIRLSKATVDECDKMLQTLYLSSGHLAIILYTDLAHYKID